MKDRESPDAAFVVGTLLLPVIGIGIALVPFLDAPAGWAALLAQRRRTVASSLTPRGSHHHSPPYRQPAPESAAHP